MATAIWTDEVTGLIAVRFDYDPNTVNRLKTGIPRYSRQWNPERKLWLIDPPYEPTVRRILGLPQKSKPHKPKATMEATVAAMFDNLPSHLHEATFKALIRIWHPDIGGDTRATQALNAWHQRQETA